MSVCFGARPEKIRLTRRHVVAAAVLAVLAPVPVIGHAAPTFSLKDTVFERVGSEKNLDPVLLYALACIESAVASEAKGFVRPYPWTLRTSSGPFYGKTKAEAVAELTRLLTRYKKRSVDIGMMQINSRWHGHRVKTLTDLLDPYTNLSVAADILNECLARFPNSAFQAIGAYHSSDSRKAARYAKHVARLYSQLKNAETGAGK